MPIEFLWPNSLKTSILSLFTIRSLVLIEMGEAMLILQQVIDYIKTQGFGFHGVSTNNPLFPYSTVRTYSKAGCSQKILLASTQRDGEEFIQSGFTKDVPDALRAGVHNIIRAAIEDRALENRENNFSV